METYLWDIFMVKSIWTPLLKEFRYDTLMRRSKPEAACENVLLIAEASKLRPKTGIVYKLFHDFGFHG